MRINVILALCAGLLPGSVSCACQDIDPAACTLLMAANPNICTDPNIGPTACPRFCKLCPLECYHCNSTVMDYHDCNTTMQCPTGQICMRKELSSYFDGHHEYEMTCQMKEVCDGAGLSFGFGRRDLSVSCCDTDLCNYPQPPTTTTARMPITTTHQSTLCHVDLVFVVDESRAMSLREKAIVTFLHNIVIRLPVSADGVHVAAGTFSNTAQNRFDLTDHTTMQSALAAVDAITLNAGSGLSADLNAGLHYVIDHALTPAGGDRPNSDNVVVIITNHGTRNQQELTDQETMLHAMSQNVIAIEIGAARFENLSTDRQHEFRLTDPIQLNQILSRVVSLICAHGL
ncbi:uncharacterized protein LOC127863480 [Dreissena polymorpha]|uniref:VWFA domain-containing protein n=1 Tax=Dreissena polymorpha TaxID=45954 RepID=A0A9D3Y578_DREPO|nr:uncharacterized protein LOC127863480 [Dreissena polymorpha]KAH3692109.1 hypothetical protein DPMN_193921 [Dreissena polymorpha]